MKQDSTQTRVGNGIDQIEYLKQKVNGWDVQMNRKVYFPLFFMLSTLLFLAGCGSVLQEVQKSTGNQIGIVDDQTDDSSNDEEKDQETKESKQIVAPKHHRKVEKIMTDPGEGKYSGSLFDEKKVNEALDQMPKGLSEEESYAYLLGLIGENYFDEKEMIDSIDGEKPEQLKQLISEFKPLVTNKKTKGSTQGAPANKKANVVVLLDASSSMADYMSGKKKLDWAHEATMKFAKNLSQGTSFSLRVFGARSKEKKVSCQKSESLYFTQSFQASEHTKLTGVLSKVQPMGWSPLAMTMKATYSDLKKAKAKNPHSENVLLVISDNAETCKGNPVAEVKKLHNSDQKIRVQIIGLNVYNKAERELKQIAMAANGHFEAVETVLELQQAIQMNLQDLKRVNEPWQLRVTDHISRVYRSDQSRLLKKYKSLKQKNKRELQRFVQANDYLRDQQKISDQDWEQLAALIQNRYKKIDGYAENRWQDLNQQLTVNFTTQNTELERLWTVGGKKKADLEKRQNQRIIPKKLLPKIQSSKVQLLKQKLPTLE